MTTDNRLAALLRTASADVPARHRPAPVAAIRARIRRRRHTAILATVAVVVAIVAVGSTVTPRLVGQPPDVPASPTEMDTATLPWSSAFVARDDTTVTVYTAGEACVKALQPQAAVFAADANRVVIGVHTLIEPSVPCLQGGSAVPVAFTLPEPLDGRTLVDAMGGQPPVYFERHLPVLPPASWSPHDSGWAPNDPIWVSGYNGPGGANIILGGRSSTVPVPYEPVATVPFGPYEGTITGGEVTWSVRWRVGATAYFLTYLPTEGDSMTLEEFEQELAQVTWP
jgi:hypothetical protein